ncbi:Sua5/YciO/YrdC/YwlC family protein [Martelella alba]|uniref:L-threonylcarbamoyladenylate synthase n=1 Tax=Martelella alba TaxID=2590451 RepID=A0ABY2SFT5_9HYPH|nr:Sua5/YciO/YrdC/YwlC family protein [Martelella alba]TKI03238.1 L-threonylcarbamoyladenylate synthase type 1 TsaC [Martelella alba]
MMKQHRFDIPDLMAALNRRQVIAYPTEAVYGLGCDPDSEVAVRALLALKQRSWTKGLILIAAEYRQLLPYIDDSQVDERRRAEIFARWPGPLTWLMPANPATPNWLTGQFSTLAVRVTAFEPARRLCAAFGKPLVSTSANLSGHAPARTAAEVRAQFGEDFPLMDDAVGGRENPSEIRDALTGVLVRQG